MCHGFYMHYCIFPFFMINANITNPFYSEETEAQESSYLLPQKQLV